MDEALAANYSIGLAFENMAVGVYYRHISLDGKRTYVHFNRAMKEFFGCDDVLSSKFWRQDMEDDHDSIVMNTFEPYREEYPLKSDDGNIFRWLVFIKQKVQATGVATDGHYIITTVIDVTKRKTDELLLEKSRLNLKIATDAGRMSTWDMDVDKKIFTITNGLDVKNPTISLEEHVMLRHFNANGEVSPSELFEVMSGKKESGKGLYMVKDKSSGEILYRRSHFMGIKEDGKVTHVIGSTQDVTESYRQKAVLQESMDELNLALEAGSIAAWSYDINGQYFHTLYGEAIAKEGISYEQLIKLIHPEDKVSMDACLDSIISRKEKYANGVFRFKTDEDGSGYRHYDSRMMGRAIDGKLVYIIGTQKDITEEYLHQEQLEEFTLKVNLINTATHSVIFDYDVDSHFISYTGNSSSFGPKITLDKYFSHVHPKDHAMVREYFEKADKKELGDFSFEIDMLIPGSKELRRASVSGTAVKDDKGNIIKYAGIRRDVSELVRLNSELKDKDKIKDLVVNHLLAGLALFSEDCRVIWYNDSAHGIYSKYFNISESGAGTKGFCGYLVNGRCTKRGPKCLLKVAMEQNSVQTSERVYGGDRHFEITAIPVTDDYGRPSQAILKLRDITENKRMMIAMEESREQAINASVFVSTLMDKMPGAIFIINPEDNFKILKVNDKFCECMGLPREELIGKSTSELIGEEASHKYDSYDLMLANGAEGSVTYEASLKIDNHEVTWMINKSIIILDGKKLILAISTDISEIKKINKELIVAKEKAQEADKLKSAFLANMSHEIRTPLNAIVGFSQLLSESDDQQEKKEFSKIISNNNQMLLRLIGDILDLSKIEAGTTEFRRDLVEVSSFFNELTTSLALKVTNPEVKFIVDNPYKTCYINLDKLRFGQVITNFVTNAIKYTHKGYIKVGYHIERHGVMVRVDDTGVGIPADKRDRVFQRFDKLDSMAQGTGLGLSIAKILTETGGGKIWFESEEGKGSSFFSWKPFGDIRVINAENSSQNGTVFQKKYTESHMSDADLAPNAMSANMKEAFPHRIRKILVAEDNESNYLLMQKMLKAYDVEWAKDGVEAVEKVAKSSYDLVLMDIKMPIMDGLDATRQIRKFNSAIVIVAITANAYAIDEEEALRAGCNEFLSKPILREDLINVLSKC